MLCMQCRWLLQTMFRTVVPPNLLFNTHCGLHHHLLPVAIESKMNTYAYSIWLNKITCILVPVTHLLVMNE